MSSSFSPRCAFAFASQASTGYLHGGYNTDEGILGDMYMAKFDDPEDREWHLIQQKGDLPGKIRYHTLSEYRCYLILLGGQKNMIENNSNVYCFDLGRHVWKKLKVKPEDGLTLIDCQKLLNR
jgi:hypothetical protein